MSKIVSVAKSSSESAALFMELILEELRRFKCVVNSFERTVDSLERKVDSFERTVGDIRVDLDKDDDDLKVTIDQLARRFSLR